MTELQHTVTSPELYERLINRLGLALESANISIRLRDEWPEELELRGLSNAEFNLIEAFLNKGAIVVDGDFDRAASDRAARGTSSGSREPVESGSMLSRSAKVIWLKDQKRASTSAKLSRHSSSHFYKR